MVFNEWTYIGMALENDLYFLIMIEQTKVNSLVILFKVILFIIEKYLSASVYRLKFDIE